MPTSQEERRDILEAVKTNGYVLKSASEALKGDREIVLDAVKKDWSALEYASSAVSYTHLTLQTTTYV